MSFAHAQFFDGSPIAAAWRQDFLPLLQCWPYAKRVVAALEELKFTNLYMVHLWENVDVFMEAACQLGFLPELHKCLRAIYAHARHQASLAILPHCRKGAITGLIGDARALFTLLCLSAAVPNHGRAHRTH